MSWNKFFSKTNFFWNDRCVEIVTTIKCKRWKRTTTHSKNVWRNYFRISNEKKNSLIAKRKWNLVESFVLFMTRRRIFNVSFVEQSSRIIYQRKYLQYLIWYAEIARTTCSNARKISMSRRDFCLNFFSTQQMRIWATFRRIIILTQLKKRLN
jgi:hypothetical protein